MSDEPIMTPVELEGEVWGGRVALASEVYVPDGEVYREAARCAVAILYERNGFDDWWGGCDTETQDEIIEEIAEQIVFVLQGPAPS